MTSDREAAEAECRKLMAKIAAHPARGFDGARVRAKWIAELDAAFDRYTEGVPVAERAVLAIAAQTPGDQGDPAAAKCGVCDRSRYANTRGVRLCAACDGLPAGDRYETLGGE